MKQPILLLLSIFCTLSIYAKEDNHLYFLENKGQIINQHNEPRTDIDFKVDGNAVTMFIGNGQLHYQWLQLNEKDSSTIAYRMDVTLVGANKNIQPISETPYDYTERYYSREYGEDGLFLKSYKKITYPNIYPNIDWVLYSDGKKLKYDFVVNKGGDANKIQLRYDGATALNLRDGAVIATTPYGNITEAAPYTYDAATKTKITSQYTLKENTVGFKIDQHEGTELVIDPSLEWSTYYGGYDYDGINHTFTDSLGFVYIVGYSRSTNNIATTGAHKDTLTLSANNYYYAEQFIAKFTSAGVRQWGTYVKIGDYYTGGGYGGGYGYGYGYGYGGNVCSDKNGNTYLTAQVGDTGLATTGAYQDTLTVNNGDDTLFRGKDLYIVKFNKNGVRQWGTYYGSDATDYITSIAADDDGNIIFSGHFDYSGSDSSIQKLVTTGSYLDTFIRNTNYNYNHTFLVKFDSNGNRLWGTFYNWYFNRLTCDRSGNIYTIGHRDTNSYYSTVLSSLVTTGAHQDTLLGNTDGLITKFSADGSTRLWATLYGGNNDDVLYSITCDAYNNLYIGGLTNSTIGVATTGTHRSTRFGSADAFIAKFDSTGSRLWGTYYGGAVFDVITDMVVGTNNKLYVYGTAYSHNLIATTGAHKTYRENITDAFLSIFNSGGQLLYGTYFGGTDFENTHYYRWNSSYNPSYIYNWNWWNNGGYYYGGSNSYGMGVGSVALSLNNDIYISGNTDSDTGMVTPGAHQTLISGNFWQWWHLDGFLAKFSGDTSAYIISPFTDTLLCGGNTFTVPYSVTKNHQSTNTFSVQLSDDTGSFVSPVTIGSVNSGTAGTITCVVPTNITPGNGYRIRIASSAPADTSEDNGIDIKASTYPAAFSASADTTICSDDTLHLNASTTTSATTFLWTGPNSFTATAGDTTITNASVLATGTYKIVADHKGCSLSDTFSVLVNPSPTAPIVTSNSPLCGNDSLKLLAASTPSTVTYSWSGPLGFTNTTTNPAKANAQPQHAGTYKIIVSIGTCSKEDSTVVKIDTAATVSVFPSPGSDICVGTSVTLVAITKHTGSTPQLQWKKNGNNISGATNASYVATGVQNSDAFALVVTPNTTCISPVTSNIVNMTVSPVLVPSVSITATPSLLVAPWELVTFTATPVNGGSTPVYQWLRNGKKVQGATNDTWGTYQLSDGDTISVILYSDYLCPNPDSIESNKLIVNLKLGIETIQQNTFSLFPNPNNGTFTLKGKLTTNDDIRLNIINSVGQIVHQQTIKATTSELNQQVNTNNLASGVYLLQLQSGSDKQHIRFTIQ